MSLEPNDLKMLIGKYRSMNIEELEARIDSLDQNTDCPNQLQNIDIATNELELKYKERQVQIELLTKSLTSSSRIDRWVSSIRVILCQFIESKN